MKKKTTTKYIFIDTNLYRSLFLSDKLADEILPILKKLINDGYFILLPQQILDEINRNRFRKWSTRSSDTKKQSLDRVYGFLEGEYIQNLTGVKSLKKSLDREKNRIEKEEDKLAKRLISPTGKTAKIIRELTNLATPIPDSEQLTLATLQRFIKGNPPFDRGGDVTDKNCDRYIWESLLFHFRINQIRSPELLIFTKNVKEWCIEIGEEKRLHPLLVEEFKRELNGTVTWFPDMRSLPDISRAKKVTVGTEEKKISDKDVLHRIENLIADKLRHSNTWDSSDSIMSKALPYIKHFKYQTIKDILKAAQDNDFISAGPYNQVLNSSLAERFFSELLIRSLEIDMSLDVWKVFYVNMDEGQQERFVGIRRTLEDKNIKFSLDELKHFLPEDIPF